MGLELQAGQGHGVACIIRSLDSILQQIGHQYRREVLCSNLYLTKIPLAAMERMDRAGQE